MPRLQKKTNAEKKKFEILALTMVLLVLLLTTLAGTVLGGAHHRHGKDRSTRSTGPCFGPVLGSPLCVAQSVVQNTFDSVRTNRNSTIQLIVRGASSKTTSLTHSFSLGSLVVVSAVARYGTCTTNATGVTLCQLPPLAAGDINAIDITFTTPSDEGSAVSSVYQCDRLVSSASFNIDRPRFCKRDGTLQERSACTPFVQSWSDIEFACSNTSRVCRIDSPVVITDGSHVTGYVNIVAGGSLIFRESAQCQNITFAAVSILVESGGSLLIGSASQPFGLFGCKLDIQIFGPAIKKGIECVEPTCGVPAESWVLPWSSVNQMTPNMPPGTSNSDYFYAYKNFSFPDQYMQLLNYTTLQPSESFEGMFGKKVIAVSYNGTFEAYGFQGVGTTSLGPGSEATGGGESWGRLANIPHPANSTTLTLEKVFSTWPVGVPFRVVVTSTDYIAHHDETLTVIRSNANDTIFTILDPPTGLRWAHDGRKLDVSSAGATLNQTIMATVADVRAAVGLLTRSVTISSHGDSPTDPLTTGFGAHIMARQGFRSFKLSGIGLEQLGQGGLMGRYPVHFHLCRNTSDTWVRDCTIYDSNTRFVSIHGTHNVELSRNVAYQAFGCGFFIEDGVETNNQFLFNLAVRVKAAALDKEQNPRQVVPIIANYTLSAATLVASPDSNDIITFYALDNLAPTFFWLRNAHQRIVGNYLSGADLMGHCFWPFPTSVNGPSLDQRWDNYDVNVWWLIDAPAFIPPFIDLDLNTCMQAMFVYDTTTNSIAGKRDLLNVATMPLRWNPLSYEKTMYPGNGMTATMAATPLYCTPGQTPSKATCGKWSFSNPLSTTMISISRLTASFVGWVPVNFAAIWFRQSNTVIEDSVLTDVLFSGINGLSGGGDPNSIPEAAWLATYRSAFVGNTQNYRGDKQSPFSFARGPINEASGLSALLGTFGAYVLPEYLAFFPYDGQHFANHYFDVYDGPSMFVHLAFFNITLEWFDCYAQDRQVAAGHRTSKPYCVQTFPPRLVSGGPVAVIPHAAYGWRQPNSFDYPPAYVIFDNVFHNVTLRHHVWTPRFNFSLETDIDATFASFLTDLSALDSQTWTRSWSTQDRQTTFTDEDGSLSGYTSTGPLGERAAFVINNDNFFWAPNSEIECGSLNTSGVSPLHYLKLWMMPVGNETTYVNRGPCGPGNCKLAQMFRLTLDATENAKCASAATPSLQCLPDIWLSGPNDFLGSLIADRASYYIDLLDESEIVRGGNSLKSFAGELLTFFPQFANNDTQFTFSFYTGSALPISCGTLEIGIGSQFGRKFISPRDCAQSGIVASFNSTSGITTFSFNTRGLAPFDPSTVNTKFCGPAGYCLPKSSNGPCGCAKTQFSYESQRTNCDDLCTNFGGQTNLACPPGGCVGFQIQLPMDYVPKRDVRAILDLSRLWSNEVFAQKLKPHPNFAAGCDTGVPVVPGPPFEPPAPLCPGVTTCPAPYDVCIPVVGGQNTCGNKPYCTTEFPTSYKCPIGSRCYKRGDGIRQCCSNTFNCTSQGVPDGPGR